MMDYSCLIIESFLPYYLLFCIFHLWNGPGAHALPLLVKPLMFVEVDRWTVVKISCSILHPWLILCQANRCMWLACSFGWMCFTMVSIGLMSDLRYLEAWLPLRNGICLSEPAWKPLLLTLPYLACGVVSHHQLFGGIKSLESREMKL